MADDISAGRVLWVELSPRGQGKRRPAVALNAPDRDGLVYVVVGSASCEPSDLSVAFELPWHPAGHCRTRLKKRTILDLAWIECISVSEIKDIGGVLPGRNLDAMQEKIRRAKQIPREDK